MGNQLFADEDECLCDSSNIDPAIISSMNKTPLFGFLTDKQRPEQHRKWVKHVKEFRWNPQ